jgi:SAM-dependent methyltransferase
VVERTGLETAQPPMEVHAMARGALSAAGGHFEAVLVADALAAVGVDLGSLEAALDFGCSSGRVLRCLAAAYPQVRWLGCDPNADAVAWAAEHVAGARFFASGDHPPLELAETSLDLAYAISVWSHFAPPLGLRWLAEMRRLLRPGGHLVMTTHGLTTIDQDAAAGRRSAAQCREIRSALYAQGWWYRAEFGADGDWGVVNPDWGTAFLTPEWMLANATPHWRVAAFAPGRNAANQDLWVLQRV